MAASFLGQLRTLLWRCVLLKKRNKRQILQEFLFPILFVSIIVIVKVLVKPQAETAIEYFPSYNLEDPKYRINLNKTFLISPDSLEVKAIISKLKGMLGNFSDTYFATETEAEEAYIANMNEVAAGLIFYSTGAKPSYAIRLPYEELPSTLDVFTDQGGCRDTANGSNSNQCLANQYLTSGFLWLQRALEAAMMDPPIQLPNISVQMLPKGEYTSDLTVLQSVSSIYFILCFTFFINYLTVNLVAEKEMKIREGMKMMGLRDSVFWSSWGITYAFLMLIETSIITVIVYTSGYFNKELSNPFIFFILMILYGWSIITLSFMLSPFFKKAQTAGGFSALTTLGAGCLYFLVSLTRGMGPDGYIYWVPPPIIWCLCLASPIALALGIDQGIYLDNHGGMTFSTLTQGEFPQYAPIIMLIVDIILYGLLAYYLDHVIPGEYGPRYAPWYCFMPSYYKKQKASTVEEKCRNTDISSEADIEPVSPDLADKAGLRIFNISKVFKGRRRTVKAVQGLSLDMYEGQITALLGHNGAGKTTLINMLCGLSPPTSGFATIYGMDVSHSGDMERIRTMCGVCPQHNILYDDLSTREHLRLFAGIKGVPSHKQEAEIEKAMRDADIFEKADTFAKNLSGGQKRKLSVAMALIGDPKIIFLDEPTAGMDPFSRRHLWSLLQKTKKDRIILLSTHFMDEADILADRKAIVSNGKLRCIGSSLFLKHRFGVGYHLDMVVDPTCDRRLITDTLRTHISGLEIQRSHAKELAYTLPLEQLPNFSYMFNSLEEKSDGKSKAESLGIRSYGVSMTTLEEVFLKLGEEEAESASKEEAGSEADAEGGHLSFSNPALTKSGDSDSGIEQSESHVSMDIMQDFQKMRDYPHNVRDSKINLPWQRFWALFKMRLLLHIRNPEIVYAGLFFPIVMVAVASVLNKLGDKSIDQSNPVKLSLRNISFRYAATYQVPNILPFIVMDSQGDERSGRFVSEVNKTWMIDQVKSSGSLQDVIQRHFYAGVNLGLYDGTSHALTYTALFNDSSVHSLPAIINLMSSALLAMVTNNQSAFIDGHSLPWPSFSKKLTYNGAAFATSLLLGIAFVSNIQSFGVHMVKDRQLKVRSQLRVAGVTFHLYWGSIFLFNLIEIFIPVTICIIIIIAAQIDSFYNAGALLSMILLFLSYLPSMVLLAYVLSFLFDTFEACQSVLPSIINFMGLYPFVAMSLCDMMGAPDVAWIIHNVGAVVSPVYCLPGGIYYIDRVYRVGSIIGQLDLRVEHYFDPSSNIILCILMPMMHMTIIYILLRVLDVRQTGGKAVQALQCGKRSKVKDIPEENFDHILAEDEDVEHERNRVASLEGKDKASVGLVHNLRKEFEVDESSCCDRTVKGKVKVAVRNLTFAVDPGEVFGLLGPNGAGKTTTLNMMIADTGPTCGKVRVAGLDVRSNMSEAFQEMGYCPQHDALWDLITMREHIEFYGLMHGLTPKNSVLVADSLIKGLKVEEHAKKKAKKLSGGTKRKLSYALSMLGNPQFVLMDEPSTGMDPQSKRFLWDTISSSFEGSDRGAILTTHYMEEADALCSRVGIMVNGQLECLGPTQHLKDKFGSGYLLEVKLKHATSLTGDTEQRMNDLERHLVSLFPHASCMERFEERGQYKIPKQDVKSLRDTFAALELTKESLMVEEYSFSQSTLEQVFLDFAKMQHDEGAGIDQANEHGIVERQLSAGDSTSVYFRM